MWKKNGADVQQKVEVKCTDGITRTVSVAKDLNYPAGWMVKITVNADGEQVDAIGKKGTSGTINADGTALGETALADGVEILDTTSEGGWDGKSQPPIGVTLSDADVRYYTTNENGQIDRLILNDVTGDLWDLRRAGRREKPHQQCHLFQQHHIHRHDDRYHHKHPFQHRCSFHRRRCGRDRAAQHRRPLWGLVDGSIGSSLWESVTGSTDKLASYLLVRRSNTSGGLSTVLNYLGSGADYVCYVNGKQTTYKTSTKYPVLAGGIAVGISTSGKVKSMRQLMPAVIDKVGAASVMSGGKKYETADDMQVYLWYKGTYYPTTLSQVNGEDYTLIGWFDNDGRAAGSKIRVLIAVRKN